MRTYLIKQVGVRTGELVMADDERSESSPSDELANADRIDKEAPTVPPQQPTGESRSDSRSTSEKPSAQHEFDSQENKVIQDLASAMHWIAAPFLFLGVLYIFATIVCLIQVFRQPASIFAVIYVGLVAQILIHFDTCSIGNEQHVQWAIVQYRHRRCPWITTRELLS